MSHLNIGHRHILPTYPVLYIFCGALGWAVTRAWKHSRSSGMALALAVAGLLGWHAKVAAGIYPHYLAYFNPIVGGPGAGYKHLVDSSLDWGQDLPGLEKWLATNRQTKEPVYLSYFGTGDPNYYGIDAQQMLMLPQLEKLRPWYPCEPGVYAISATMLQHVYMPLQGEWTKENEMKYQELKLNEANFRALKTDPTGHPELSRDATPAQWNRARSQYEQFRFARLCHYLRARKPDAMIGYSILIFRLTQSEIDSALNGSTRELGAAIERAATTDAGP